MASSGRPTAHGITSLLLGRGIRVQHVHATDTGEYVVFVEQAAGRVDEAVALLDRMTAGYRVRRVAPAVIRIDPRPDLTPPGG